MDQRIFDLKLSMQATSLYLLMTGLSDGGATLSRDAVLPYWNSSPEELDAAMQELMRHGVAAVNQAGAWLVLPSHHWQPAAGPEALA